MECGVGDLGLPASDWHGRAGAELLVEQSGEQVSVRGRVTAPAGLECVRCLRTFELRVVASLEVFADRAGHGRHVDHEEQLERDRYMKFHDGRHLDVSEEAREVLILELPIAPRCREDCRGLCPRCGADLNEGSCGCGG